MEGGRGGGKEGTRGKLEQRPLDFPSVPASMFFPCFILLPPKLGIWKSLPIPSQLQLHTQAIIYLLLSYLSHVAFAHHPLSSPSATPLVQAHTVFIWKLKHPPKCALASRHVPLQSQMECLDHVLLLPEISILLCPCPSLRMQEAKWFQ